MSGKHVEASRQYVRKIRHESLRLAVHAQLQKYYSPDADAQLSEEWHPFENLRKQQVREL